MAEFLAAKPSMQIPGIIFGPAINGYHAPLFRENSSTTHSYSDLSLLSSNNTTIIGFKEKNSTRVARFEFSSKACVNLKQAFEDRILEIANITAVWTPLLLARSKPTDLLSLVTGNSYHNTYW